MSTVLVVDDEWAIAEVLGDILSDQGYRVVMASNGKQALARISEERPDLILLDFMMPILDGPATLQALMENPATASIPVLLVSSLPLSTIRDRCAGYADYVQKPFLFDELIHKVAELLSKQSKPT